MNNPNDAEIQQKIFNIIKNNPGLNKSKIAQLCNISLSSIESHLLYLQQSNKIILRNEDGYERYYSTQKRKKLQDKRTSELRGRIYSIILENPGLHLSKIAELLKIRISLAEYHLNYLEKNEKIFAVKEGSYYKRYYSRESGYGKEEKKTFAILRQEYPLRIVLYLLKHPHAKHKDIQQYLGISPPRLTYHLNKLVEQGILAHPTFEVKGYSIINPGEITSFLKKYRIEGFLDLFRDVWGNLDYYDREDEE